MVIDHVWFIACRLHPDGDGRERQYYDLTGAQWVDVVSPGCLLETRAHADRLCKTYADLVAWVEVCAVRLYPYTPPPWNETNIHPRTGYTDRGA